MSEQKTKSNAPWILGIVGLILTVVHTACAVICSAAIASGDEVFGGASKEAAQETMNKGMDVAMIGIGIMAGVWAHGSAVDRWWYCGGWRKCCPLLGWRNRGGYCLYVRWHFQHLQSQENQGLTRRCVLHANSPICILARHDIPILWDLCRRGSVGDWHLDNLQLQEV